MDATIVISVLALVIAPLGVISAAVIARSSGRDLRRRQELFTRQQESVQFLSEKLDKLYLPLAMRLTVTQGLFDRYFESSTSAEEKTAIEHEWREPNNAILNLLMNSSKYLEPDAPKEITVQLLQHLVQWETVYKLKYLYKVYDGPVFAGIGAFGVRKFPELPDGRKLDDYFLERVEALREQLHQQLQSEHPGSDISAVGS